MLYEFIYLQYIYDDMHPVNLLSFDQDHIFISFSYPRSPYNRIVIDRRNRGYIENDDKKDAHSNLNKKYIYQSFMKEKMILYIR